MAYSLSDAAIKTGLAARAALKSEERFRSVIENSSDIIALLDREGYTLYESPAVEHIMGLEADELVGRPPLNTSFPTTGRP